MAKTSEDIGPSRLAKGILTSDASGSPNSNSSATLENNKYETEITESFDRIESRMAHTVEKMVNDDG